MLEIIFPFKINIVREKAVNQIINMLDICKKMDTMKTGLLNITTFSNIFKFKVESLTDDILIV